MQHSKCCVRNVPRVRIPNSPPKWKAGHKACFLLWQNKKRDSNKEGADLSAEENSPVDCFRRRGQGAKRREGIRQYAEKSLTLRQSGKQVVRPAFCFGKTKRGIRTRREQTCLRKKTVRWIVFADVVKERSDAKAYGSFFIPSVVKDDTSPCNKGRLG